MNSGIYSIKNVIDGKRYIGQSSNLILRWRTSKASLRGGCYHNEHFQNAWKLYGESSFEWAVLELCSEDMLDSRERSWIAYYDSTNEEKGYNNEDGGSLYKHHSKSTLEKLSVAAKGHKRNRGRHWKCSDEFKEKCRKRMIGNKNTLGYKPSEETLKRRSESMKGRVVSPETRAKISASNKGKGGACFSEELRKKLSEKLKQTPVRSTFTHSEETRKKISESKKGVKIGPMSDEQKQKIRAIRTGTKRSPETCAKISLAKKGCVISEETKKKMSQAHLKLITPEERLRRSDRTRESWKKRRQIKKQEEVHQ